MVCHNISLKICDISRYIVTLIVPYRTVPYRDEPYRPLQFRDLPFPRFGLKKPPHSSQKPYRFFIEKRSVLYSKKTPFSVSVFNREPYRFLTKTVLSFFVKKRESYVQSSLPFSIRILYREPYRSKKRTVFGLFTKSFTC